MSLADWGRRTTVVWSVAGLPADCTRLVPVPAPLGGALVFSANALLYFDQRRRCGAATNAFAATTVDRARFPLAPQPAADATGAPWAATLDGAASVFLGDPSRMLVCLRSGELVLLELATNALRKVVGLRLQPVAARAHGVQALLELAPARAQPRVEKGRRRRQRVVGQRHRAHDQQQDGRKGHEQKK